LSQTVRQGAYAVIGRSVLFSESSAHLTDSALVELQEAAVQLKGKPNKIAVALRLALPQRLGTGFRPLQQSGRLPGLARGRTRANRTRRRRFQRACLSRRRPSAVAGEFPRRNLPARPLRRAIRPAAGRKQRSGGRVGGKLAPKGA